MEFSENFSQYLHKNAAYISGLASGFVHIMLGQPFDTIKVRLQAYQNNNLTVQKIIQQLLYEDGLKGFYKGTTAPLVGVGAIVSIQFGFYENFKNQFSQFQKELSLFQYIICGSASCLIASFITIPVEHIRIKMQVQHQKSSLFPNSYKCFQYILRQYGIQGLYKGMIIGVVRELFMGLKYGGYGYMMQKDLEKINQSSKFISLYNGALAGFCTWLLIYPIDSIKTKIQSDNLQNPKYQSYKQIIRQTNLKLLYYGIIPCLQRSIVVNMGGFLAYEQVKQSISDNTQKYHI